MGRVIGSWLVRTWGVVAIVLGGLGCAVTEDARIVATIDHPAAVTAVARPNAEERPRTQAPRAIVKVTAFQPPREGAVEAVVKAMRENGVEEVIGRFGITPHRPFRAEPGRAQRFGVSMPLDLSRGPAALKIYLQPVSGDGQGASIEFAGVDIE